MIIDTHMHLYDPSRPEGVPWPSSDDELLYRTVLPEHCREVSEPEGVTGIIAVEASPWVEDNAWVIEQAEADPFIVAVVGNLEPGTDQFGPELERFAAHPLFRGLRIHGAMVEQVDDPSTLDDLARLAQKDLELDLLVQTAHLPTVARLASELPDLRLIINHVAVVLIDGNPPDLAWVEGMSNAAEHPNVYCKVSGLASSTRQTPAPTEVGFYAPTLDVLWDAFGEDRLMYGSDWPVCSRFAQYDDQKRVVAEYFGAKGEVALSKYFCGNAKAAYKWPGRP